MTKAEKALRQEWESPQDFWKVIHAEFDFQLDAAANSENALCDEYYSGKEFHRDALDGQSWLKYDQSGHYLLNRIYCNPGFAQVYPWAKLCHETAQLHPDMLVCQVGLISCSTKWWNEYAKYASEIRLLRPRVQFVAPPGIKQTKNMRETCLIIYRPNPHRWEAQIRTWEWMEEG